MNRIGTNRINNIGVLTSGGDCPGLNACIRSIVLTADSCGITVVGIKNGFDGLIDGEFETLTTQKVKNIIQLGGTILKSSRSRRFTSPEFRNQAFLNCRLNSFDALIVIGGDGSLQGTAEFIKEHPFPVIGIPKTIDNDIYGTDQSIGCDTALNTIMEAIDKIRDTANSHHRIFVVEVMGRKCGYLALNSAIASGSDMVLIPEFIGEEKLLSRLSEMFLSEKGSVIIMVAEGDETGGAKEVRTKIQHLIPDQSIGLCVLGHIQRGGSPSAFDRILASKLGCEAILALQSGVTDTMIALQKGELVHTSLKSVRNRNLILSEDLVKVYENLIFS